MLTIIVPGVELYDEDKETFVTINDEVLTLEHSLVSLSKWESKFQKAFLGAAEKTTEEIISYIEAMITTENYSKNVIQRFSAENINEINAYIDSTQSATTFGTMPQKRGPSEIITSELIYYWMVAFNIPFECQHWHLNRLFALIRICNIKNNASNGKKMSRSEVAERNRALNEKRRAEHGTTG